MIVTPSESSGNDDKDIPFKGWVDMRVKIGQNDSSTEINVPFS